MNPRCDKPAAPSRTRIIDIGDELEGSIHYRLMGWEMTSSFPTKETSFQGYGRQTPRAPRLDEIESGEHGWED